jgi:predicted short-subunit dehydrogenase-like oxidoreductase (DUF2520 family)
MLRVRLKAASAWLFSAEKRNSAILPGMSAHRAGKPQVAIVGAGNLATALALSLRGAGYSVEKIISGPRAASLQRAGRLAREVGASVLNLAAAKTKSTEISAQVIWFCVPDAAIAGAARTLSNAIEWTGKTALHSSGALTSDELAVLCQKGASVASVHPLMTFVHGSRPPLARVPFAVEGDTKAVRSARRIVRDLGGEPFNIRKQRKEVYHAWGMFASPLLTSLLAASERVALASGIPPKASRRLMLPILRQTLANYEALGAPAAFSGPLVRGDVATVQKHLEALKNIPAAREIYVALARNAIRDLPVKNRAAMKKILIGP